MGSARGSSLSAVILSYSVIVALLGCFVLSADAIRCHQCNSHLDEDCNTLRLTAPRGVRDDQYLDDCLPRDDNESVFCRKTVTKIEMNEEHRIVRGCGWNKQDLRGRNGTCIIADNEGFFETICACFSDACNSAPMSDRVNIGVALGAGIFMLAVTAVRRS